jgi:hypothetical protein
VCVFCSFITFLLWFFIQSVDAFLDTLLQDKFRQKEYFSEFGVPLPDFVQVMHYLLTFVILFELKHFGVNLHSRTCYISFLQNNAWFMYVPLNMTLANRNLKLGVPMFC